MNRILTMLGIGQVNEEQEPKVELISNMRFLFMSLVGVALIIVLRVVFQ